MTVRVRIILAVLGALLVVLAIVALAYTAGPVETAREQYRPAPTLFVAPPEATVAP